MRLVQSGLLILAISVFAAPTLAGTVDSGSVTTFESGSTLSSSAMNATIGALVSAINDNAARVAAIEEARAMQLDIAGKEYCVSSDESGFWIGNTAGNVGIAKGVFRAGVSFASGGTFTVDAYEDFYKEGFPDFAVMDGSEPLGKATGTWTLTGNILAITIDGESENFAVSSSGDMIVGATSYTDVDSQGSGVWYTGSLTIMVEVVDATTCNY